MSSTEESAPLETESAAAVGEETSLPVSDKPRWTELALVFSVAWLFFVALTPHIIQWLNPVTGDEPFYLMTAQSLLADHDIDETNNYNRHDYWKFSPSCDEIMHPGWAASLYVPGVLAPGLRICLPPYDEISVDLTPHFSSQTIRSGNYTKHGLGLSVLILPAYALGNIFGIRLVVALFMTALAALLGLNLWMLAWETTGKRSVAWAVWVLLTFSLPLFGYAFLIFPAIPAALCVIYAFRRIRLAAQAEDKRANNAIQAFMIGLCLGFLPWLHSLYITFTLSLATYWLLGGAWRFRAEKKRLVAYLRHRDKVWGLAESALLLLPVLVLGGLLATYYLYYFGKLLPNEQDHAGFVEWVNVGTGVLGLFLDQKWGLLFYAPIYLLALSGLALLVLPTTKQLISRRNRQDFIWLAIVILPYFSYIARYKQWWGEWCPPARYLTPFLPLLALPLGLTLESLWRNWRGRALVSFVANWSFLVSLAFAINPKLFYHWQDNQPAKLLLFLQDNIAFLHSANIASWFPSYVTVLEPAHGLDNTPIQAIWVLIFTLVGIGAAYLSVHIPKKKKHLQP
ncbi:MAG: hypothetical protein HXX08_18650 [Chloroflexi bacterium]|uniref:Uncharacterized protein n=1 Tax=Candidatus Chlorohelix allophototropha TaxID=3003348 RepID=A0A8T7M6Y4_9CHLR|nr:hypothetical protein [Chloroflexota bacterium]WJW69782.1 hypothetical protein OZ401_003412 [Chloroflexota bacterium L227-S17]